MSTLMPEVEEAVLAAIERDLRVGQQRARRGLRLWRHPTRARVLAVVAAVVPAFVIAAVALTFLSRGRTAAPSTSSSAGGVSGLEQKLAIFRRPQSSTDRINLPAEDGVIPGLTRRAAVVDEPSLGRVRIYVIAFHPVAQTTGQPAPGRPTRFRYGRGVDLIAVAAGPHASATAAAGGLLPEFELGRTGPSALFDPSVVFLPLIEAPHQVAVAVVPDGVARVSWVFTGAGLGVTHPRPVTVKPLVIHNIAIAVLNPADGPLAQATWYDAAGRVVRTTSGGGQTASETLIRSANNSRYYTIAPALPANFSLFRQVAPEPIDRQAPVFSSRTTINRPELNYWQTRYVTAHGGAAPGGLWIVPGPHAICFFDFYWGHCISLPGGLTEGGIFAGGLPLPPATSQLLSGLVPDGNRTVTLVFENGKRLTVPVIDHNVWVQRAGRLPIAIIDRGLDGQIGRHPLRQVIQ